jgi:hypothetical protein
MSVLDRNEKRRHVAGVSHVFLFQSYIAVLGAATMHTTFEMTEVCVMATDIVYSNSSCTEDILMKAF